MNGQDLLEIILHYCNYDGESTILLANDLLYSLDRATILYDEFNLALNNFAEDTGRCPCCGKSLSRYTYQGEDLEFQGFPCSERFSEYHCCNPDCSNY